MNLDLNHCLVRSRKEGMKVVIFQRWENSRGRYVLLSVLDEMGKVKSVVILEGNAYSSWNNFRKGILEVGGYDASM